MIGKKAWLGVGIVFGRDRRLGRSTHDLASDDAGYFTIFGSPELVDTVRNMVRQELDSAPGWSEVSNKGATEFRKSTDDGNFFIRAMLRTTIGTVISVTQRVDSDRMAFSFF